MPVPASDLPSNLVPQDDLPIGPVPSKDMPNTSKPDVGGLESFGRGAAQAFGLGYSPQAIAALKTGHMIGSDHPEYAAELAKQKAATDAAWEKHPYLYGTGMVAAAVPAALNAVFGGPEEAAALGGAGLLAESGNIAGLAGTGLRALTGGSKVAGKVAGALENPLVQGAIYGSSEGDTLNDKAAGALAGVAGAKIAPMVLGAAGKGVSALTSKIAPKFSEQVSQALSGGISKGQIAGAIGDDVGFSVPAFVGSEKGPNAIVTGGDFRNSMAKASNQTIGEIGGKLSDIAGNANANDTGEAIRNSIASWATDSKHPNGFKTLMDEAFKPVNALAESPKQFDAVNLKAASDAVRNSARAKIADVEPHLSVISMAEQSPNGLSFEEMHSLRQEIADLIDFNRGPNGQNIDEKILKKLYGAVTDDMKNAANGIGGIKAVQEFNAANKEASKLYDLRSSVLRMTGNTDVGGVKSKQPGQIYQGIENAASRKSSGPSMEDAKNLRNVLSGYDPETWDLVGNTYVANRVAPQRNFSFGNLQKTYHEDLHPEGKDLLFKGGSSDQLNQTLEKIDSFGKLPSGDKNVGHHIDELSRKAGLNPQDRKGLLGELGLGIGEAALFGGLPVKTMAGAGVATGLGAYGARNIAKPLSTYAPTTGQKIVAQALKKSAPSIGAQAINPLGAGAVKAGVPIAVSKGLEQLPPWLWDSGQASGGRVGRKSGGRTSSSAKAKADQLIMMADRIKKEQGKGTEPLLNVDDTTIAKALEIANRGI